MVSALERQREENLRRNRELLLQLGLDAPIVPVAVAAPKSPAKKKAAPRKSTAAKRRISEVKDDEDDDDAAEPAPKRAAVPVADSPGGVRRSSRHAGKPRVSYTGEIISLTDSPAPSPVKAVKRVKREGDVEGMDVEREGRAENVGNRLGTRIHNPKTYGSIPGIEVGTWWETRAQCSTDAIHAPFVAGISAGPQGAYSIALSGGYEDDVDLGYAFTYTGSGGRDLKGTPTNRKNLRTAPQSSHQTWDNSFNAALKKSVETKKPVRVIRGFKLHSEWAPASGYRYDGLYRVEKAWMERGLNREGFQVCKFALKRMDGQPPLPRRDAASGAAAPASEGEEDAEEEDEGDDEEDGEGEGDAEDDDEASKMDVDSGAAVEASPAAAGKEGTPAPAQEDAVSADRAAEPAPTEAVETASAAGTAAEDSSVQDDGTATKAATPEHVEEAPVSNSKMTDATPGGAVETDSAAEDSSTQDDAIATKAATPEPVKEAAVSSSTAAGATPGEAAEMVVEVERSANESTADDSAAATKVATPGPVEDSTEVSTLAAEPASGEGTEAPMDVDIVQETNADKDAAPVPAQADDTAATKLVGSAETIAALPATAAADSSAPVAAEGCDIGQNIAASTTSNT